MPSSQSDREPASGLLLPLCLLAIFFLPPGMVFLCALIEHHSLKLEPAQLWIYSAVASLLIFLVVRLISPGIGAASRRYVILSALVSGGFTATHLGLQEATTQRWIDIFLPAVQLITGNPTKSASAGSTPRQTPPTAEETIEKAPPIVKSPLPLAASAGNNPAATTDGMIDLESTDGKKIRAKILSKTKETLRIRRVDNQEFEFPISRLNDASRKIVEEYRIPKPSPNQQK